MMKIPDNFILGAASSAWQTEGWQGKKDGQASYLDTWFKNDFFVWHDGKGPDIATDFMNRYQEDVDLMKKIGLTHYRTSINWSRFFTDYERLVVDEDYAQHIDNVITALVDAGIKPMIAIEHYELPQYLQDKFGGWNSKEVVRLYVEYAKILFSRYGDRVKEWYTFNEPIVPQTRIHLDALRYPYDQDSKKWMQCNFNKVLATAYAVKAFKATEINGRIGLVHNWEFSYPRSKSNAGDLLAAENYDLLNNRVIVDPVVKGKYPEKLIKLLKDNDILFDSTEEELSIIAENTIDILGINLYFPKRVKEVQHEWSKNAAFGMHKYYDDFELPGRKMNNSRGWEIYPPMMYDMAEVIKKDYDNFPWFISENGMGIEDEQRFMNENGIIQDDYRINFIQEHLYWLLKAIEEGSSCEGYMLWAFTDCVSPMNAFKNRYGLVSIDLGNNLNRSLKKSAYWYKQLIETHELDYQTKYTYR